MNSDKKSSATDRSVRSKIKSRRPATQQASSTTTMQKISTVVIIALGCLGMLATGVLGTETRLLFFWPACVILGMVAVFAVMRGKWTMRSAPADTALASALTFGIYLIVRGITSPVIVSAREDIIIVLACAVVYILSATALSKSKLRMCLVGVLIIAVIGNLAMGFIHFSGSWSFHIVPGYMRAIGGGNRIGGFFNNPNHLADFLGMMALFLAGPVFFGRGSAIWKLTLAFISLSCAIGVAVTVSRGALVGLVAGVMVLVVVSLGLLRQAHPHLFLRALLGVAVLAVAAVIAFISLFSEQARVRFRQDDIPREDPRSLIWRAALAQHAEHPLTGAGARMFYEGCVRHRTADTPGWSSDAVFAHNEYVQMLADYGWVGLALLAVFLACHFMNGWSYLQWYVSERFPRTASLQSRSLGLTVGALSALTVALVHAAFEFHFHVPATALTAAFFFGILANPGKNMTITPPRRLPLVRPLLKITLFASGVALLCGAWFVGRADFYAEKAAMVKNDDDMSLARIAWLGRAIECDPYSARTWYERGRARLENASGQPEVLASGFLQRAVSDLEMARALNPHNNFMACALADAYDATNRPDEAEQSARDAIVLAPLFMEPRLTLAMHFHRHSRFAEAEECYLDARETRAGHSNDWHALYKRMLEDAASAENGPG